MIDWINLPSKFWSKVLKRSIRFYRRPWWKVDEVKVSSKRYYLPRGIRVVFFGIGIEINDKEVPNE